MTINFELFSNESTKVRVLDVPGFFGAGDAGASVASAGEKAHNAINVALGRMRNILQIQTAMHMKFRRILYFLPVHGALKRSDSHLETELTTMAKYFGKSIFNSMVVIATLSSEAYDSGNPVTFSDKAMGQTKRHFGDALSRVLHDEADMPEPPILFISMQDTCEEILANVKAAQVASDHITLQFNALICARCGSKTKVADSAKIAVYTDETETSSIPYNESTCHPLFVPKYTKVARFFGGIVYVISFHTLCKSYLNETCIACHQKPGSHGCMLVNTKYELKGESLMVDHTNNTNEPIKYQLECDQEVPPSPSEPSSSSGAQTYSFAMSAQNPIDTSSGVVNRETDIDAPDTDSYTCYESKGT